jgi:AAA ATPase domain
MKIERFRIHNYKSFADSGWIDLTDGFNVVVGKNSSGKTAFLESLRLNRTKNNPHFSLERGRDTPVPPKSTFEFRASFAEKELKNELLRGGTLYFPIPAVGSNPASTGRHLISQFFDTPGSVLALRTRPGENITALDYPSHCLFEANPQMTWLRISPSEERTSYTIDGPGGGTQDTLSSLVANILQRKLYVFKAERLNIGEIGFTEEKFLNEDASNLPRVLFALTTNPTLFDRYNRHVNEIFPYIKRVAVFPKGTSIDVRLW